jgi:hypothetical protein
VITEYIENLSIDTYGFKLLLEILVKADGVGIIFSIKKLGSFN